MKKADHKLKATILDTVNNQLKSGNPPETRHNFNRLIGEDYQKKMQRSIFGKLSL